MGETTEMILDGFLCHSCGSFIDGEEPGYPRNCEDCEDEE
nr:MAG TPA: NADH-PPase NADH pyrophosphatase zinc ribbon domain [Bacteriophage sp.]